MQPEDATNYNIPKLVKFFSADVKFSDTVLQLQSIVAQYNGLVEQTEIVDGFRLDFSFYTKFESENAYNSINNTVIGLETISLYNPETPVVPTLSAFSALAKQKEENVEQPAYMYDEYNLSYPAYSDGSTPNSYYNLYPYSNPVSPEDAYFDTAYQNMPFYMQGYPPRPAVARQANSRKPTESPNGSMTASGRIRTTHPESGKENFKLDVEKIKNHVDVRTTLMIKNIPNKYSQVMVLAEINVNHIKKYDFFYLPIDFNNKCNVGYAFINFIDPLNILDFFKEFNNRKWNKFNSEKICEVRYGRIQGKTTLINHFKNSSVMDVDEQYRPLLFYSTGPEKGEPENFPMIKAP